MWTLASRHSTIRPSSQIHPSRSSKVGLGMALSSLGATNWFGFCAFGFRCKASIVTDTLARPSNYVNNTDLMSALMPSDAAKADSTARSRCADAPMYELSELFFFVYRRFVGHADRLLEAYGFGRAHHRVLYFVCRRPGLTIAELLEILRITKQSLNRVLRELVDKNFVETRAGALDRRRRQLYATLEGERLALRLAQVQTRRFASALEKLGDSGLQLATDFLNAMIDPQELGGAPTARLERAGPTVGARRL